MGNFFGILLHTLSWNKEMHLLIICNFLSSLLDSYTKNPSYLPLHKGKWVCKAKWQNIDPRISLIIVGFPLSRKLRIQFFS